MTCYQIHAFRDVCVILASEASRKRPCRSRLSLLREQRYSLEVLMLLRLDISCRDGYLVGSIIISSRVGVVMIHQLLVVGNANLHEFV